MVYDSLSKNDSIVILTDLIDEENNPIIASVRPNGKGRYDLEIVPSNFVTSIHGRENIENQIKNAISSDKMLFYDKQKSQELFRVLGLQLSQGLNNLDSNVIVHQSHNIVKSFSEKSSENTAASQEADGEDEDNEDDYELEM